VAGKPKKKKAAVRDDEPVFVVVRVDAKTVLIAQAIPPITSARLASKVGSYVPRGSDVVGFDRGFVVTGNRALVSLAGGTLTAGIKIPVPPTPPQRTRRGG
jgi:hypothetical protein